MDATLQDRIIKYIESHHPIPYSRIVAVASGKGFTELEVLQALDKVGRSKSIITKTRKDEVWYYLVPAPTPTPAPTHTTWLRDNYPWPQNFEMPFPEIDMSYLFLKTKEERDAFKAEMSGRPVYLTNKYARK